MPYAAIFTHFLAAVFGAAVVVMFNEYTTISKSLKKPCPSGCKNLEVCPMCQFQTKQL